MGTLFCEIVAMYLLLFGLIVGGVAFYVGYRVLGVILVCGMAALLIALAAGMFSWQGQWKASPE